VPDLRSHFAKNIFFSCIDDRLQISHHNFVKLIGGAFTVKLAGGGLALIHPEDSQTALKQIALAFSINKIDHVYIESHLNCGAYKAHGIIFGSRQEEIYKLYGDLEFAKKVVIETLLEAGAEAENIKIITRVVDVSGIALPSPINLAQEVYA
jgi:carbonic anhydrase